MEFLQSNWQFIVYVGLVIIEAILLVVVKRHPVIKDNSIFTKLMTWIDEAEQKFRLGSDKKLYVMSLAKDYLGEDFDEKVVSDVIEYILRLPQKKGANK